MRYVSTRGAAPELGFVDVLLSGLAIDGGLYVPEYWPTLKVSAAGPYAQVAAEVMNPFVDGEIDDAVFARMCAEAYAVFDHPAVVPLVQIDHDRWLLELFHGPTLAFKDVALQLVGRLFDHVLAERDQRLTIIGATSGDTGSAAIDGVRGCERVDIIILYPAGRTSEVQRRQMTTVDAPNVHTIAIDGTFDDCQDLVKAMFTDLELRNELNLSAVNSINWARVMAQVPYYVAASMALQSPVTFSVPTGNFGNVLAGWIARQMGAQIDGFIIASNANDILPRFIDDGEMSSRSVIPTLSPSMDIQVSSNFERLLFEMNGRDGAVTAGELERFRSTGVLRVDQATFEHWIHGTFEAVRVDDEQTLAEIARVHAETNLLIDPHTATGTAAARAVGGDRTVVTLATAHPAKFPEAVHRATGIIPELPAHLADLFDRPEKIVDLPADLETVRAHVRRLAGRR
jgi:threonine synthase